ncbi:hypothetical protein JTE90_005385 [Oedothorax gibbosus]|uniref:Uncharacterized protein n=1 Tax=Oedothorax gibbosus TaxID=931172 RepID=A0AAV6V626_9ARAC|nr:hypothetical protein JTE90_005385 [Oedothorax gibbosus]
MVSKLLWNCINSPRIRSVCWDSNFDAPNSGSVDRIRTTHAWEISGKNSAVVRRTSVYPSKDNGAYERNLWIFVDTSSAQNCVLLSCTTSTSSSLVTMAVEDIIKVQLSQMTTAAMVFAEERLLRGGLETRAIVVEKSIKLNAFKASGIKLVSWWSLFQRRL